MRLGLEYADILKVSEEELEFLTGDKNPAKLWRDGMKIVVVTHGAGGATIYTPRERFLSPGFSVQGVDTTGAGDGFVAGLMHGVLSYGDAFDHHLDETRPLRANAVGAITTTSAARFRRCRPARKSRHFWRHTPPQIRQFNNLVPSYNENRVFACPKSSHIVEEPP